jgi:threonine synthase
MLYYNIKDPSIRVTFREAVSRGISSDMGLFMPEQIPTFGHDFFSRLHSMSLREIAFEVGSAYVGDEIAPAALKALCDEAFNFPVEIQSLNDRKKVLELFHGPTAAFKDFGARFMSLCMSYFSTTDDRPAVVLVATSVDTGGAVANSFLGLQGIDVIILYPSGRISPLQEKQLTTLGRNITALEVEGTFDDCQSMVKSAFTQLDTCGKIHLTSANSINIARLIPQSFYYYLAVGQEYGRNCTVSVPCGNFGNLTAAVMSWNSGLPVDHFIASTNINRVVPAYLKTGVFTPAETVSTIANAMDVGNPSNFERLAMLFDNSHEKISSMVSGYWFDDDQIIRHIQEEYDRSGYILDPHGAVASLGLDMYLRDHPLTSGLFAATAHPAKFKEIVEPAIGHWITTPAPLVSFMSGTKSSVVMKPDYRFLKDYLTDRYLLF